MPSMGLGCCTCDESSGGTLFVCVFSCCGEAAHTVAVTGPGGYSASDGGNLSYDAPSDTYGPLCLEFALGGAGTYTVTVTSANPECLEHVNTFEYDGTGNVILSTVESPITLETDSEYVCIPCCDNPIPKQLLASGGSFSASLEWTASHGLAGISGGVWVGDTSVDTSPSACSPTTGITIYFWPCCAAAGDTGEAWSDCARIYPGYGDYPEEGPPTGSHWFIFITFPVYAQWHGEGEAYLMPGVGPEYYGVFAWVTVSDCGTVDVTFSPASFPTCASSTIAASAFPDLVWLDSTCADPGGPYPTTLRYDVVCAMIESLFPINVYE